MIGDKIKTLRTEKDLLQKDLAEKLSLSQQTISLYESGRREPDYQTLNKIARFFDVSVDFILGNSDIRNPYKEDGEKYPEIHDIEKAMEVLLDQPGLMLKGEVLNDEDKIILANAIQMGLRLAEEIKENKNKNQ